MIKVNKFEVPLFDSRGDVESWLGRIQWLARAQAWDETRRLWVAITSLTGQARAWFEDQNLDYDTLTWTDLAVMLKQKYPRNSPNWKVELARVRRAKCPREYTHLFRDLKRKFPLELIPDAMRVQSFLNSLSATEGLHVRLSKRKTLAEALDAAEEVCKAPIPAEVCLKIESLRRPLLLENAP